MLKEMENIMNVDDNHSYTQTKQTVIVSGANTHQKIPYMTNFRLKMMTFFSIGLFLLTSITTVVAQQTHFSTPEAAADKLYDTVLNKDLDSVKALFGEDNLYLLPVTEIEEKNKSLFLDAWNKSHQLIDGKKDEKFIEVGVQGWTFPIPLVKGNDGWSFDTAAGAEIVLTRRIGRNELSTMQASLAYYDAQREYAEQDRNNDGMLEYAQKFKSTSGNKDGLYWFVEPGETPSPLGALFSENTPEGAYHGYYYKILKGQGTHARGGAYSYMSGERMSLGFALVAWPAEYDESGVMTFIINQDGVLYEKNLGQDTHQIVSEMTLFEPGDGWVRLENGQ
ncbi:MAG: DUF2950 domain-containing protein [Gammaproteobacteria bacterium]|nr:DUF2950 domain-containing protein [Gammaproteobacteria bacterium]